MNKKKEVRVDIIPANTTYSHKQYLYLIKKYGSGVINSGTNIIIVL